MGGDPGPFRVLNGGARTTQTGYGTTSIGCRGGSRYVDGFRVLWLYGFMVLWFSVDAILWKPFRGCHSTEIIGNYRIMGNS